MSLIKQGWVAFHVLEWGIVYIFPYTDQYRRAFEIGSRFKKR